MNTTNIYEWSWEEAVESIETSVEQDLEGLDKQKKIKYIELLKSKLNKIISLGD